MMGPQATLLENGARLHLQHGPIDLVIGADPAAGGDRRRAFGAAAGRFAGLLDELVAELPLLRRAVSETSAQPTGLVARRMDRAVRPLAAGGFVTPMAAVAGAVADEILAAMAAATPLVRAYVNNGGDIALHLIGGARFSLAMAGLDGRDLGRIAVVAGSGVGGVATSGQGGRSLSFGIAESVTVLAADAAAADAAATLIANAVDLPGHPSIRRCPAHERQADSDLGDRAVVRHVGALSPADIRTALNRGAALARAYHRAGLIHGAALYLRGGARLVGAAAADAGDSIKRVEHA